MGEFLMPSLGADMDVGTVLEWRVAVGDVVHRGDIIAVVDTDKSDIEVEVFEDGVVEELLVDVGKDVAVGTPLARIRSSTSPAPRPTPPPSEGESAPAPAAVEPPTVSVPTATADRRAASPWARRRAQELGVDLTTVRGSGRSGAVSARDVEAAASTAQPARSGRDRQSAMRRAIGDLMARSAREIPQYHVASTIDLEPALAWLEARNATRSVEDRVLPAAVLLSVTARAAARCPSMNGTWVDGWRPSDAVHLGVAIARRGGGLSTPTIRHADELDIDELMAQLAELATRARAGRLRTTDVAEGTITVTNLGERGAEEVQGIIFPPQVALVGFGRILDRAWIVDGAVVARRSVRATVTADHRASDGHDASRLLDTIDQLLQHPEALT